MSYPDHPIEGHVNSLGWGIAQDDGSTGFDLLPNISPTFEWIRLAQRVPVRVHLDDVPERCGPAGWHDRFGAGYYRQWRGKIAHDARGKCGPCPDQRAVTAAGRLHVRGARFHRT